MDCERTVAKESNTKDVLTELVTIKPRLRFSDVERSAASVVALSPREFRRKAPWLLKAWRKVCKEYDREVQVRDRLFSTICRKRKEGSK